MRWIEIADTQTPVPRTYIMFYETVNTSKRRMVMRRDIENWSDTETWTLQWIRAGLLP